MARALSSPCDARAVSTAARALPRAINAGDLDAATACFASGGTLVTPDATAVQGGESVRGILEQMIDRSVEVDVTGSEVQLSGTVATVSECWTIRSPAPDGTPYEHHSFPLLVLRLVGGVWKLVAASPWRQPPA